MFACWFCENMGWGVTYYIKKERSVRPRARHIPGLSAVHIYVPMFHCGVWCCRGLFSSCSHTYHTHITCCLIVVCMILSPYQALLAADSTYCCTALLLLCCNNSQSSPWSSFIAVRTGGMCEYSYMLMPVLCRTILLLLLCQLLINDE